MARQWLSIRVELLGGRGTRPWPYPGRIFAVGASHTFADLAEAINAAFARWDLSHLSVFTLTDRRSIADPETGAEIKSSEVGSMPPRSLDLTTNVMATVQKGDQFRYVFDLGDQWTHRCTVAAELIDPHEECGVVPTAPAAYWGWGDIPDQYGRRWDADDGSNRPPKRPPGSDPMLEFGWPEQETPSLPVSLPELREAAYRNDADAVAAALEKHDLTAVLQQAGGAVLSGYRRDPERLSSLAFSLHNRLTDRDLPGDTELAALLLAVLQGKPLPEPNLSVDLDQLGDLLEGDPAWYGFSTDRRIGRARAYLAEEGIQVA